MLLAFRLPSLCRNWSRVKCCQQSLVRHESSSSQHSQESTGRIGWINKRHAFASQREQVRSTARIDFTQSPEFTAWLIGLLSSKARASKDFGFARYVRQAKISYQKGGNGRRRTSAASATSAEDDTKISLQSDPASLLESCKKAFRVGGEDAVQTQLDYAYHTYVWNKTMSKTSLEDQVEMADLRYPAEWYPATRYLQRVIHLHVGPTNSGKTYNALKRLESAQSGLYAGPLRLLAHEIYTRMNAKGIRCDLITGDEQIHTPSSKGDAILSSRTVEMIPLNTTVDVAVVDEIQMMGDDSRGWAWTQALLGLRARELHLCGEERTVPLVRDLVASMGDRLEIHKYERLSPLKVMSESLNGSFSTLRQGDCVVAFSKVGIHTLKRAIEKVTKRRVAIIYGSLPPEIRAQQAKLFNDPTNDYDVLVASDAIGMGLNLAIRRIIFESVEKFDGSKPAVLSDAQIKQIAGRAGRYRVAGQAASSAQEDQSRLGANQNLGLITTLEQADLPIVRRAMQSKMEPITSAGIFPPAQTLQDFAAYFPPTTSFSYIMKRLHELSRVEPRFKLCGLGDQIGIADVIQGVESLSLKDRITFCAAPCSVRDKSLHKLIVALARCVGDRVSGGLLDIPGLDLALLDEQLCSQPEYLQRLEVLHKSLVLYLWLSYRFSTVFDTQEMAFHVKRIVEGRIDAMLTEFSASTVIQTSIRKAQMKALRRSKDARQDDNERTVKDLPANGNLRVHNDDEVATPPSSPEQRGTKPDGVPLERDQRERSEKPKLTQTILSIDPQPDDYAATT